MKNQICFALPAIFPSAQTACSHTLWCGEDKSLTKFGTAPAFTTNLVWLLVPEAIFVKAQAASNCSSGLQSRAMHIFKIKFSKK